MPNLQHWLNAWVKVANSKNNAVAGSQHDTGRATPSNGSAAPSPILHNGMLVHKAEENDPSLRTAATSVMSQDLVDPELQAIRKFSGRKHRRRLQRTNSFSDLIREKASKQQQQGKQLQQQHHGPAPSTPTTEEEEELCEASLYWQQQQQLESTTIAQSSTISGSPTDTVVHSNSKHATSPPPRSLVAAEIHSKIITTSAQQKHTPPPPPNQDECDNADHSTSSSSRFWGGLFGSETTQLPESQPGHHLLLPKKQPQPQRGDPFHSAALRPPFTSLPARHRHYHAPPSPTRITSTLASNYSTSNNLPLRQQQLAGVHQRRSFDDEVSTPTTTGTKRVQQDSGGILVGGVRLPFFNLVSSPEESNIFGGKPNCPGCKVAEKELQVATDNLEYMRGVAIHKELTCVKCQDLAHQQQNNNSQNVPTISLKNASQQLLEVTGRHKNQIEQLLKQRTNWQRNIHLKLEKFANLCRNMNNESSLQSEKARTMEQELNEVRNERDEMAAELERLRTEAALFEQERQEHQRVKNALIDYESRGLDHAEEAMAARDEIITKLSSRLETALDTLQMVRQQQRQRRQIIFPPKDAPAAATAAEAVAAEAMSHHSYIHNQHHSQSIDHSNNINHNNNNRIKYTTNGGTGHLANHHDEVSRLRQELRETQRRLEATQLQARQRET